MSYAPHDTVVLTRDLPEHGLCAGDLGAVVEVYSPEGLEVELHGDHLRLGTHLTCHHPGEHPEGLEVEFVTASGRTKALVTLKTADVRPIADSDLVAVRSLERSA